MQNFMLLPDKLMEVIFEYAQPPDVYNLHFSNKTIHERRYMHSLKGNADDGHFSINSSVQCQGSLIRRLG